MNSILIWLQLLDSHGIESLCHILPKSVTYVMVLFCNLSHGDVPLKTYLEKGLCGEPARDSFRQSCGAPVTYYPKWKNLLCRLCEYLAELEVGKPSVDKLFRTAIDIEHIQSYTDIKDPEAVRAEWGEELHCLGNLVMFESSRNRSVRNDVSKKPAEYAKSVFASVRELSSKVEHWTRDDAVARREKLTARMEQFLFSE